MSIKLFSGLVQEPSRQVEEARATPDQRLRGLLQGRFRAPVQRADAAVPRGQPGGLRLPHLQQLGGQGAQPLPRQGVRLGTQHAARAQPGQVRDQPATSAFIDVSAHPVLHHPPC